MQKIKFLGWERPAIELVVEELLALNKADANEFRRATVVVPTAESGRRLRELLAERAECPLLIPRIILPGHLLPCNGDNVATEAETIAAWVELLRTPNIREAYPHVFPCPPLNRNEEEWAFSMAETLMRERQLLVQACCSLEQIETVLPADIKEEERARWLELFNMFTSLDNLLLSKGRLPREQACTQAMAQPSLSGRGRLLVLACVPDISTQLRRYLTALGEHQYRVEIWVNAPETLKMAFDAYGCPNEYWETTPIPIPNESVTIVQGAQELAMHAVQQTDLVQRNVELCVADSRFLPEVTTAFRLAGWRLKVPEGRASTSVAAIQWVEELLVVLQDATKGALSMLGVLRNGALLACVGLSEKDQHELLYMVDNIMQNDLPASRERLLQLLCDKFPAGKSAVEYLFSLPERVADSTQISTVWCELADGLRQALAPQQLLYPVYGRVAAALRQHASMYKLFPLCATWYTALQLLRRELSSFVISAERREETSADALGWMEMPYTSSSHVLLLGMHEGCVPETPLSDSLLPDYQRQQLGMDCVQWRVQRDSFVLSSLLHRHSCKVSVVVAQQLADGTPIIPSRLLTRYASSDGAAFAERVKQLFCDLKPGLIPPVSEQDGWYLGDGKKAISLAEEHISLLQKDAVSPWADTARHFSPTVIGAFLTNPLLFWLKKVLKLDNLNACNDERSVMHFADYGTMMHDVLKAVVLKFRTATPDATKKNIRDYSAHYLDKLFEEKFGASLPLQLLVQKRMIYNRLYQFATFHERDLQDGWEPVPELIEAERVWQFAPDVTLKLKIDRVDRHRTGQYRVIDYKTHDKKPEEKHLQKVTGDKRVFSACMPGFPLLEIPNKNGVGYYRWIDVQLPLYAHYLRSEYGAAEIPEVAYYNLPRGVKNTEDSPWRLDESLMHSALQWSQEAIRLIRAGRCLVSAESLGCKGYADFGALAPEDDPRNMMSLPPVTQLF